MRRTLPITAALVLGLAACSGGKDADSGQGMSADEVANQLDNASTVEPGQYQARTTLLEFEIAGMPEAQVNTVRSMFAGELEKPTTFCLTPEQAKQGRGEMLQKMAESDCSITSLDINGGSMKGEMNCKGNGGLKGTVKVEGTSSGDSSSMTLETTQTVPGIPGEGARLKWRTDARRVGECTG